MRVEGKDVENDGGTVSSSVCDGPREGKGGLESDLQHGGWPGTYILASTVLLSSKRGRFVGIR